VFERDIFDLDVVDLLNYNAVKEHAWFDKHIMLCLIFTTFDLDRDEDVIPAD